MKNDLKILNYINNYPVNACIIWSPKKINNEWILSIDITIDEINNLNEIRITAKDVKIFLEKEKGYKINKCLKSSVLTNSGSKKFGSWTFLLEKNSFQKTLDLSEELTSSSEKINIPLLAEDKKIEIIEPKKTKRKKSLNLLESEMSLKSDFSEEKND